MVWMCRGAGAAAIRRRGRRREHKAWLEVRPVLPDSRSCACSSSSIDIPPLANRTDKARAGREVRRPRCRCRVHVRVRMCRRVIRRGVGIDTAQTRHVPQVLPTRRPTRGPTRRPRARKSQQTNHAARPTRLFRLAQYRRARRDWRSRYGSDVFSAFRAATEL